MTIQKGGQPVTLFFDTGKQGVSGVRCQPLTTERGGMSVSVEEFLANENRQLRSAGCNLAVAAIRVIDSSDGVHRLSLAVSDWCKAVANEGGRPHPTQDNPEITEDGEIFCLNPD